MPNAIARRLRVTLRCLTEDLGLAEADADLPLEALGADSGDVAGLIKTFMDKRSTHPTDEDRIEHLATGRIPMHPLRRGKRIRGLTWSDEQTGVVWLVAAHFVHRSGERMDSYAYFRSLPASALLPSDSDFARLREEEALAARDAIFNVIDPARAEALNRPGDEIRIMVGPVAVSLVATSTEPPPHVKVAVSTKWDDREIDPPPNVVLAIVTRVYLQHFRDWVELPWADDVDTIAGRRALDELVFEWFVGSDGGQ